MPLVNYFIGSTKWWALKAYDQWTLRPINEPEPESTRCKTISKYFELYAGPEYDIHYKYSELESVCFLCFMYGPGIPILFIIGFFSLPIAYITERLSLAKLYRKPPLYSKEIVDSFIRMALMAPLLYSGIGFWMFSNRQIFENKWDIIETSYITRRYHHKIIGSLFRFSTGSAFLITFAINILVIIFGPWCSKK